VQVHDIAMVIPEDLHLEMLGPSDVTFQEDRLVSKGPLSLALRLLEQSFEIRGLQRPASRAPRRRTPL